MQAVRLLGGRLGKIKVVDYINVCGALQDALGMYGGRVNEERADYQV